VKIKQGKIATNEEEETVREGNIFSTDMVSIVPNVARFSALGLKDQTKIKRGFQII